MDGDPRHTRCYLFLQGMATPFFAQLGVALARRGHTVRRINFTAGDRLFWRLPGSISYRGALDDWPRTFEHCLNEWHITDVVLFGDWRPLHAAAIRIARLRGLAVHVFEEGYVRPNWVTLEQGGVNNNSSLPRDPVWYRKAAGSLPPWREGRHFPGSFAQRAVHDVLYHCWSQAFRWRYPGYRSHLPTHPFVDYAYWIRRFARAPTVRREAKARMDALAALGLPYFLVPLQLDTDSQLRINSPFRRLAPAIEAILESFARHAPNDTALLLKEHPLDSQQSDWRGLAMATAERFGMSDRVFYVVGGDVATLIRGSRGVVTVNSTAGMLALALRRPVIALAQPIYHMPGLTYQDGIDRFWTEAEPPDAALFDAFRRVVVERTQIKGGFFSRDGLAEVVAGAVTRLEAAAIEHRLTRMSPRLSPVAFLDEEAFTLPGGAD
jgi:capsular polysaccharide export protein